MTAHSKRFEFDQNRSGIFSHVLAQAVNFTVYLQNIVSVYDVRFYTIAFPFICQVFASILFMHGSRQAITIVFYTKQHGEIPYGGKI